MRDPFDVTVTGRAIQSVTFSVDGRRIGTVRAKAGRKKFKVTINPRGQSRRVHRVTARITFSKSSGSASTVRYVDAGGRTWLHIRLPARPNGQTGRVPRYDLGPLKAVRTMLRINRATLRATLHRDERRIWTSRVGIGARSTPTPPGRFWIRSRLRGLAGSRAYGPYAFGTGAYSVLSDWPGGGVIGIHGTDEPQLIPGVRHTAACGCPTPRSRGCTH
ncbi:MAG: L,D-transpeptidase [Solirubrobacteraceae bacterium]